MRAPAAVSSTRLTAHKIPTIVGFLPVASFGHLDSWKQFQAPADGPRKKEGNLCSTLTSPASTGAPVLIPQRLCLWCRWLAPCLAAKPLNSAMQQGRPGSTRDLVGG